MTGARQDGSKDESYRWKGLRSLCVVLIYTLREDCSRGHLAGRVKAPLFSLGVPTLRRSALRPAPTLLSRF